MAIDPKTMARQQVAQTHFGTEFNLSPDGKWLAYVEGFDVYVAPFRPSGKVIQLVSQICRLPVVKVSDDVGENVHWSGDSKTLYWSLGETLYSKAISDDLFTADDKGTPAGSKASALISRRINQAIAWH